MSDFCIPAEQIAEILRLHEIWRRDEKKGKRANLRGAGLRGANLRGAYLNGSDLRGSDLRCANLRDANLGLAHLNGADLRGSDLRGSDLRGANLSRAYLSNADLSNAVLRDAHLCGADLSRTGLSGACLSWASYDLLSEVLRREAGNVTARRALAGLILVSRDRCWPTWLQAGSLGPLEDQRTWAMGVLSRYVVEGDAAPDAIVEVD